MGRQTYIAIIREVLSVVFAVLLALGINNYWQERSNKVMGEKSLISIASEIQTNLYELDTSLVELNVELDSLVKSKERIENEESSRVTLGYSHPILTDNAWTTSNITQAVLYIEPEVIMDIADLYTMQEMFEDFGLSYFKLFSSLEFNKKENELTVLKSNIRQVQMSMSLGNQLQEAYRDFFEDHREILDSYQFEWEQSMQD